MPATNLLIETMAYLEGAASTQLQAMRARATVGRPGIASFLRAGTLRQTMAPL